MKSKNFELALAEKKYFMHSYKWSYYRFLYVLQPFFKYAGFSFLVVIASILVISSGLKLNILIDIMSVLFLLILSLFSVIFGVFKMIWNVAVTEFGVINRLLSPELSNDSVVKCSEKILFQNVKYILFSLIYICISFFAFYSINPYAFGLIFILWIILVSKIKLNIFLKSLDYYNEKILTKSNKNIECS
ncbi:MAG: hypothetical protein WCK67_00150 [bacterium]